MVSQITFFRRAIQSPTDSISRCFSTSSSLRSFRGLRDMLSRRWVNSKTYTSWKIARLQDLVLNASQCSSVRAMIHRAVWHCSEENICIMRYGCITKGDCPRLAKEIKENVRFLVGLEQVRVCTATGAASGEKNTGIRLINELEIYLLNKDRSFNWNLLRSLIEAGKRSGRTSYLYVMQAKLGVAPMRFQVWSTSAFLGGGFAMIF